jgi:hypothetical protein
MISRFFLALGLAGLMLVFGIGSYMYLGSRQTNLAAPAQVPTAASPSPGAFNLPGTLFVAQSGAIYSLSAGRFHPLTPSEGWTQLAPYTNGRLMAVKRNSFFSDVYVLSRLGKVIAKLTSNTPPSNNHDTAARHWSFYPKLSRNQKTLFMSYDSPKFHYDVPMSIWAVPLGGTIRQGRLWTISNDYTGGDIQPLPLASGALIYTKYFIGPNGRVVGAIWLTTQAGAVGRPLTHSDEDCAQPSLSPNGRIMAMICTHDAQVSYLTLASFNGSSLGTRRILISNQLAAQPTWAPDSSGIAYLAPKVIGAGFQLWWLPKAAYAPPPPSPVPTPTPGGGGPVNGPISTPTPAPVPTPIPVKPIQMTTDLGFDATSPMVWIP